MAPHQQQWMLRRYSIEFVFAIAVSCAAIAFLLVPPANSELPLPAVVSHGRIDVAIQPFDPNISIKDRFNDVALARGGLHCSQLTTIAVSIS